MLKLSVILSVYPQYGGRADENDAKVVGYTLSKMVTKSPLLSSGTYKVLGTFYNKTTDPSTIAVMDALYDLLNSIIPELVPGYRSDVVLITIYVGDPETAEIMSNDLLGRLNEHQADDTAKKFNKVLMLASKKYRFYITGIESVYQDSRESDLLNKLESVLSKQLR